MQREATIAGLRAAVADWRGQGARIALVPTMGNLHAGHLALVERARALAERVVVSIFVNPLQFDRADDLAAYPRTLEADAEALAAAGADLLFAPPEAEVYPAGGSLARVEVAGVTEVLEGASRPGHFTGVATVVAKLFNMVQPDVAVFGEKDWQQLLVIRRLAADLDFPVAIEGLPTVREPDGLALSSRNGYLSPGERARAPRLYAVLRELVEALQAGEQDLAAAEAGACQALETAGFRPDYISVRRAADLALPGPGDRELIVLAAAWLGRARLIDNLPFTRP
ncbi:MAG: pantoate--beta-alanine ligase [Gammaproteobacteria bacterium]|nr:pantoate--beta-alanine ligase [Gammaproteobacteria bacterium]MDX5374182.1 pantoate--beta-alanine ligase [Gammaproteobacteria bacterium]